MTRRGNNYKVVHRGRQTEETGEINFCNLLPHSPLICLATDTLPLGIFGKLELCYNQKKAEITPPPQMYLRDL